MGLEASVVKIAIYSRKSKFTGVGESIDNQIEMCRAYIISHFGHILNCDIFVYEDEGFSGSNTKRPQFSKMISDARQNRFNTIICYRLDRISRNIGDFANLIEELNCLGISFVSIKEQFDTSSPMGRAMMYIASVFSQLERETIAERIKDNMHELAKTGRWLGGVTPTGYRSKQIQTPNPLGRIQKSNMLELVEDEAAIVKLIFDKFIEYNALSSVETYLMEHGILTKNHRNFSVFTIRNIITNPVYMVADEDAYGYFENKDIELYSPKSLFRGENGIMAYNKTIQKTGKTHEIVKMCNWIIAVGAHKAIIPSIDWIKANEQIADNRKKNYRRPRSNHALLSGLILCKNCNKNMRPKLTKQGETPKYCYLCIEKEKSRSEKCNMQNLPGNLADETVLNILKDIKPSQDVLLKNLNHLKIALQAQCESSNVEHNQIKKEKIQAEINTLTLSLKSAVNTPAEEYIINMINDLHEQKINIEKTIASQEKSLISNNYHYDNPLNFSWYFDNLSVDKKRNAIRSVVDKLTWDGEELHIYMGDNITHNTP